MPTRTTMKRNINLFKQLKCISAMDADSVTTWEWFVNKIAPNLDSHPIISDTAFTPHDFSYHCFGIYKAISLIFGDFLDQNNDEFSNESLLLLNIAVLFHDYSMSLENNNRLNHSETSATQFKELYETWQSSDASVQTLSPIHIEIIQSIIKAHSDIKEEKNGKEEIIYSTIDEITVSIKKGETSRNVYVKFLAGILRLADELDTTAERIGDQLANAKRLDFSKTEQANSFKHWEKLLYFKYADVRGDDYILIIDNNKYNEDKMKSDGIIAATLAHANSELEIMLEKCFNDERRKVFPIRKIKAKYDSIEGADFSEPIFLTPTPPQIEDITGIVAAPEIHNELKIIKIDEDLSKTIDNYILDRQLLLGGHFNLNDFACSNDWVDTKELFDNREMLMSICKSICTDFQRLEYDKEKTLLVGVERLGSLVASIVAYDLGYPFSYIIPHKSDTNHSLQDKRFSSENYDSIILFTDVIASCHTVTQMITENEMAEKSKIVYSVLFRRNLYPDMASVDIGALKDVEVRIINDGFPITLFPKNDCKVLSLAKRCGEEHRCLDCNKIGGY